MLSPQPKTEPQVDTPQPATNFLQRHWQKLIAVLIWAVLLAGYFSYARANNLSLQDALMQIRGSFYGPLIYILLYALRPLIFFPATALSVTGGVLFGPIFGILYTVIASNLSALVAYMIGRYLGQGVIDTSQSNGVLQRYTERLRNNSFETVLIMRLIFLPYDLVNYLCGFLRIDWRAFLLASALGSIPGTISIVLIGASGNVDLQSGQFDINPWSVVASVVLILVSIGISRYFKRRESKEI
jgi:uncharacterized membrane protein YdjX (TVP38/TMEM64 family)